MLPALKTLPEFLEVDEGGFISVKGHRIGLNHIIREYERGLSAEAIKNRFRSLELALIHRVLAFYLENEADVANYCRTHDEEMDQLVREHKTAGPSLEELKRRAEARRSAKAS